MNVLYCADTRFPIERANGVQTMATCHALASLGHDVTLLTRPDTSADPRDPFAFYGRAPIDRLRFERVPASAGGRAARVRFLLHATARAAQTGAILYTRDLGLAAFLAQLPSRRRPRVVYESHGLAPTVSEELPRLLGRPELRPSPHKLRRLDRREQRVWRRAAAYVTITRALADELASRYGPRHPVFVVPDGATPLENAAAPPRRSAPAPSAIAGYAGHLYPWKGVDVFVRALALTPNIRGLIVGGHPREADRERVESLIDTLGLRARIELTGLVPPGEVMRHLCRATMLVLPNTASAISERYTSPLKLFEYLTLGRPIVASDLPSIREVLTPGETALLVPPGDPRALAAAMNQAAGDPDLAARLGDAALALAPCYTWEARATPPGTGTRGRPLGMISPRTVEWTQCPDCEGALTLAGACARCGGCGRTFDTRSGVLDLRPTTAYAHQTKYLDPELHADARHESVAPPVLGSKIRNDQLRAWLRPGPGERVVDLGCGSGRTLMWNAGSGADLVGIDVSPFFAREAVARIELILGDLRRLPLRSGVFRKAWSLDVLEHLPPPALRDMLREANRVLDARGELFVYTHVRKNGWIAIGTANRESPGARVRADRPDRSAAGASAQIGSSSIPLPIMTSLRRSSVRPDFASSASGITRRSLARSWRTS